MIKDGKTTIAELKKKMAEFRDERKWRHFHNPKNLVMSIAIEAAELMELFQWKTSVESEKIKDDKKMYEAVSKELADVIAYCLSLAEVMGIDIASVFEKKLAENAKKYPKSKFRENRRNERFYYEVKKKRLNK